MKAILLFLLIGMSGCAFIGKQIDYQKLCMVDAACLSDAKRDAELAKTIAGAAYPAAGAPVGAAILALALWFRGRKKKEAK